MEPERGDHGKHCMMLTNAALIYRAIENLRATQIGLGHIKPSCIFIGEIGQPSMRLSR